MAISKIRDIALDIKEFPMPTALDVQKVEVAALTCKSMKEFAAFLNLDVTTIKIWCRKSSEYYRAFNSWKLAATFDVEKSLAKKAIGFTKATNKDVITRAGTVETLTTENYYPPDTAAAQFWLKNIAPEEWKDKTEVDINVTANIRQWLIDAGEPEDNAIDITPVVIEPSKLDFNPEFPIEIIDEYQSRNALKTYNNNDEGSYDLPAGEGADRVDLSTSLAVAEAETYSQPANISSSEVADLFGEPIPAKAIDPSQREIV